MSTSKKELKKQVRYLNEVLLKNIEYNPGIVESAIKFTRVIWYIDEEFKARENIQEIKKRKLVDMFMRKFESIDIQEALEIDKKEAESKLKSLKFTTKEKNIILQYFRGDAERFLTRYNNGEVIN